MPSSPLFFVLFFLFISGCAHKKASPQAKCLTKTSVIEFGSNRLKSKVFGYDICKNASRGEIESLSEPIEFSKTYTEDFRESVAVDPKEFSKAISYLAKLRSRHIKMGVKKYDIFATGIFRRATNIDSFFEEVEALFSTKVTVVSSLDEALLALKAVNLNDKLPAPYCVWDIGGDSMLFACRKPEGGALFALGLPGSQRVLKATQAIGGKHRLKGIEKYFLDTFNKSNLQEISLFLNSNPGTLVFGLGGVHEKAILETLKAIKPMTDNSYTLEDVTELKSTFKGTESEKFTKTYGKNLPINVDYVLAVMGHLKLKKIQVSSAKPLDAFMGFKFNL